VIPRSAGRANAGIQKRDAHMKKDKEKVLDEVWTEDRVREFLDVKSYDDVEEDFHMLLKAYQSMRVEDFEKFVTFFVDDGRSVTRTRPSSSTSRS
jgi:hypothetical protein